MLIWNKELDYITYKREVTATKMQLSKKPKFFCQIFIAFLKSK